MRFRIGERVVHPVHGVGTVKSISQQRFVGEKALPYYEVVTGGPTVWVPVNTQGTTKLRGISSKASLNECRSLLMSHPVRLDKNHRVRQVEIAMRLRGGLLPARCAVVRALRAQSWSKPLGATEQDLLRRISKAVCDEWAASDRVSTARALNEIEDLLRDAHLAWSPQEGE
jgi:CarD family transcriptional regulator, regulator of rRNA transcription